MTTGLIDTIAEILYSQDLPAVSWAHAIDDDRMYYLRVAEVVVDTVVQNLRDRDEDGQLLPAADYLDAQTAVERLRGGASRV